MSGLRLVMIAMLVVLGGLPTSNLVDAQAPAPPPVSLSALIDQTLAAFPVLQADVVEIQDRTLTISAGRQAGVVSGLAVEVYREGREIRHPRTGQVLGRAEQPLGRAVVTHVFDGYSLAAFDGTDVSVGARVRTGTGKATLTLVSFTGPGVKENLVEAATNEIYEALLKSGRFSVTLGDQMAVSLRQQGISPEEFLAGRGVAEAAQTLKAENILALQYRLVERRPFIEARLFTSGRRDPRVALGLFVPSSIQPVTPGRFSGGARGQATAPERKPRSLLARLLGGDLESRQYSADTSIPLVEVGKVDFVVGSMDVAVAPGDRVPRVALTDGSRLFLYKIENRTLVPEWTFSARSMGQVFSVQLADLLGDGTLQIVANRFDTRIGMNSMIVGLRNGKPAALVDLVHDFLLAVDEKGAGVKQSLWVQPYSPEAFFTKGRVDRMVLRNGTLVRESSVVVPPDFRATGAAMVSLTAKDQRALAYIDEHNRLRVMSGTDEVWSSSSQVGGGLTKIEVHRWIERGGRSYFYQLEPIPLAIDLDGDGIQELIVPQNHIEGMLAVIFRGPAGLRLQQLNSGFEGLITGLGGFSAEDGGAPTLVAAVVRHKTLLKTTGSTQIIMTVAE
jgi:hypothetical protein